MEKKKRRIKRIILAVVIALITVTLILVNAGNNRSDAELRAGILEMQWDYSGENVGSYASYLDALEAGNKVVANNTPSIVVNGSDYINTVSEDKVEKTNTGVMTYIGSNVSYEFNVEKPGTYYIEVGYVPTSDGKLAIKRNLYINGEIPFDGAKGIVFDRVWKDSAKDFLMQTDKNQGFPTQVQDSVEMVNRIESADRSVVGPYMFYFESGKNTVSFEAVQSTMEITYVKLVPTSGLVSYSEYLALHADAQKVELTEENGRIDVQAEDTAWKSAATLLPQNDRTSAETVPSHYSNIVLNTIGGASWQNAGDSITWEFDVPKTGLYRIATRFLQGDNRDFYSAREVKINGEVPFSEAGAIPFFYDSKFQVAYLGTEDSPYYFYFEEGKNRITFTVTLGNLVYASQQASICVKNLNELTRELTAILGSVPDQYRDYKILESIPDMKERLCKEYSRLTSIMESVGESLDNTTKTTEISTLLIQLEKIIKKPDSIPKEFETFSDNVTAIANWMLALDKQPLQLDYIMLCGETAKLPRAEANFFKAVGHNIMAIIGSFTNDYTISSEESAESEKKIVVWMATSTRDQYDIAQRMINNAFKDKDFKVELKMVGADVVMKSTLTDKGPDAAIQLDFSMPTNFAYRGAGYDLTQFEDFEEISERFAPGAMEYFKFNGGVYALPDEMTFPVMFYRKDILEKLNLSIPNTWDELEAMLPYLQADNMSIYFNRGTAGLGGGISTSSKPVSLFFASNLYQNGVDLYRNDGEEVNLDTLEAELVFKKWTEYYTKQSFQVEVSLVTRFRRGEIPIFIDDYIGVNSLKAGAPEIDGLWDIAPIPGTVREDGTFDRSVGCMAGSSMIIKTSVERNGTKDEAWEFLKWWTSKETQLQYAEEQQALLGAAAEFPIANVEAILERSRGKGTYDTMSEILSWVKGVPQVPGGYITGREIENAFNQVVNNNTDPVDTLFSRLRIINNELKSKREEFGLTTKTEGGEEK